MNHSIYSADRATHLKIVVVALVAGIAVAGFGISARTTSDDGYTQTAKANTPFACGRKAARPAPDAPSGTRRFRPSSAAPGGGFPPATARGFASGTVPPANARTA